MGKPPSFVRSQPPRPTFDMSTMTLTSDQIASLGALEVYDDEGGKVKVASLFDGGEKTTVIFIRFVLRSNSLHSLSYPSPFLPSLTCSLPLIFRHFYCAFDKVRNSLCSNEKRGTEGTNSSSSSHFPSLLFAPTELHHLPLLYPLPFFQPHHHRMWILGTHQVLQRQVRSNSLPQPQTKLTSRLELTSSSLLPLHRRGDLLPLQNLRRPNATNLSSPRDASQPPSREVALHERDPVAQVLEGRRDDQARREERRDGLERDGVGLEGGCL